MPPPKGRPWSTLSRRAFCAGTVAALSGCEPAPAPADRHGRPESKLTTAPAPTPAPDAALETRPRAGLALARAFPALAARLPHTPLGVFPTPIERASALGKAAGIDALYVKRDDLSSEIYGGGKTRKLELLLAEAIRAGADTVITFGGAGSNHALATAIHGARLGLRATLMLAPQVGSDELRQNLLAARRAGAELRFSPSVVQAEAEARRIVARSAPGRAPHIVPTGGTSPLGNLGFVNAACELMEQVAAGDAPEPDTLFVAMGTMGCAVGLCVGLRALGAKTAVVPVRASSAETSSEGRFLAMFDETVAFARSLDPSFPALRLKRGEIKLCGEYLGKGYARPTPAGLSAIDLARRTEGWALEPTYTGKALAAVIGRARALRDKVVLFWSTHNARPLDVRGVRPTDLPAAFQAYFAAQGRQR